MTNFTQPCDKCKLKLEKQKYHFLLIRLVKTIKIDDIFVGQGVEKQWLLAYTAGGNGNWNNLCTGQ